MHRTLTTRAAGIATTFGLAVALAAPVHAVDNLTRCDDDCTSDCKLVEDLKCCSAVFCSGNGPINISSGVYLNMNGFDIECLCGKKLCSITATECLADSDCPGSETCVDSGCTTCSYAAVQMDGGSSAVKNTASTDSTIRGNFGMGVDCQSTSSSQVMGIGIKISGSGNVVGINNCAKVKENVVTYEGDGLGTFGIWTEGVANSDYIRDNYLDKWVLGIFLYTDTGGSVDHNFVYLRDDSTVGIGLPASVVSALEVERNIIVGGEDQLMVWGNATSSIEGNVCDPGNDGCAECIDDGYCDEPTAPFTLP